MIIERYRAAGGTGQSEHLCVNPRRGARTQCASRPRATEARPATTNPYVSLYHDVPRKLVEEALSRERAHPSEASMRSPWPLAAWPSVPTRFVLCTEDRFFPADFMRRLVAERLNIIPDEIAAGHCVALSRPQELADILAGYTTNLRGDLGVRP